MYATRSVHVLILSHGDTKSGHVMSSTRPNMQKKAELREHAATHSSSSSPMTTAPRRSRCSPVVSSGLFTHQPSDSSGYLFCQFSLSLTLVTTGDGSPTGLALGRCTSNTIASPRPSEHRNAPATLEPPLFFLEKAVKAWKLFLVLRKTATGFPTTAATDKRGADGAGWRDDERCGTGQSFLEYRTVPQQQSRQVCLSEPAVVVSKTAAPTTPP